MKDIKKREIRCVGDPDKRFQEDALRMMRAIRFATQLGFMIEKNTFRAICENHQLLKNIAVERIRDEFMKILDSSCLNLSPAFPKYIILYADLYSDKRQEFKI